MEKQFGTVGTQQIRALQKLETSILIYGDILYENACNNNVRCNIILLILHAIMPLIFITIAHCIIKGLP